MKKSLFYRTVHEAGTPGNTIYTIVGIIGVGFWMLTSFLEIGNFAGEHGFWIGILLTFGKHFPYAILIGVLGLILGLMVNLVYLPIESAQMALWKKRQERSR